MKLETSPLTSKDLVRDHILLVHLLGDIWAAAGGRDGVGGWRES